MKKTRAIAFSLWGDKFKYTEGLIINVQLAKEYYPGWIVDIAYDDTVPGDVIMKLEDFPNVKLRRGHTGIVPVSWRFTASELYDYTIFRDADSRITQREANAVKEWTGDGSIIHVMRDHPHHGYPMLGGMWGIRGGWFNMTNSILNWQSRKGITVTTEDRFYDKQSWGMVDMDFLRDIIYPKFSSKKGDCC